MSHGDLSGYSCIRGADSGLEVRCFFPLPISNKSGSFGAFGGDESTDFGKMVHCRITKIAKMIPDLLIPVGLDMNGEIRTVDEVPRGLACRCSCPGCGGWLVARHGKQKAWHFAHAEPGAGESSCQESSIHVAAKQLLAASIGKSIVLPPLRRCVGRCSCKDCGRKLPSIEWDSNLKVKIVQGELEKHIGNSNRRVDILIEAIEIKKGQGPEHERTSHRAGRLIVEIAVSNPKDWQYASDVSKTGVSAIEIQLSIAKLRNRMEKNGLKFTSALKQELLPTAYNKRWLFNRNLGIPLRYAIKPNGCRRCNPVENGYDQMFPLPNVQLPESCIVDSRWTWP